jgi:hypothetical protein
MCSNEGCRNAFHYIIDSTRYCKNHAPMDLGLCKVIKRDGKECGCPSKRSYKGINTCLMHVPKSSTVETCSICLDDCKIGTKPTACGHFFHSKCLKEWKNRPSMGHTCPVCRFELSKPYVTDDILDQIVMIARDSRDADEFIQSIIDRIDPIHINVVLGRVQAF